MINTELVNAGIYVRVSTERQAQEGYSISAQKSNLTKFANQQGWNIYDIYADEGISGKNIEDRPDVKRLILDIKAKKIDVVILYKFDRLTRDMSDTEDIIKLIQQYNIQVYTISGGTVDVSTATGRFMIRLNGAVAQLEREQTIERVKTAFIQKVKEGKSLCCYTPSYGYDRPKHQEIQTINEEEAKVVRRVFKMYNNGKTFTEIANILNAEEVPTKLKGRVRKHPNTNEEYTIKSVWQAKTIRLMLSNVNYIGGVRYGTRYENGFTEFNGLHEPIIDMETWNETQSRLGKIKKIFRTNHPKDNVYYCETLVCGICGNKLTTQRTIRTKSDGSTVVHYGYRCVYRERGQCTALGMSHPKVEEVFLNYIDNIQELDISDTLKLPDDDADLINIENLRNQLNKVDNKRKEVMHLFMQNEIDHYQMKYMMDELNKKYSVIECELKELEVQYQPKTSNISSVAKTIKEHWNYLSNKERLEFLNRFVERIVIVNRDTDKVNGRPEIIEVKFYDE